MTSDTLRLQTCAASTPNIPSPPSPRLAPRCHPPSINLNALPDDILLRIISLTGPSHGSQVGAAYRLGSVSHRLRRLLEDHFLTSITVLSQEWLAPLSLSNSGAARIALTSFFTHTSSVRELSLGGCSPTLLTKDSMAALAASARYSLAKVSFTYCVHVTDDVVQPLLQCPNLRSLSLASCGGVTGTLFDNNRLAPLEFLDLSWVRTLTHDGVRNVAAITTLKEVVLMGCESVTNKTFQAFSTLPVRLCLKSINISYCPVRDEALMQFLSNAPNLRRLTLAENTGNLWSVGDFTISGVEEMRSLFPYVDIRFTTI